MALYSKNPKNVVSMDKYKTEAGLLKRLLVCNIVLTAIQLGLHFWQVYHNGGY